MATFGTAYLEIITANETLQLLGLQERKFLVNVRAAAAALDDTCAVRNSDRLMRGQYRSTREG